MTENRSQWEATLPEPGLEKKLESFIEHCNEDSVVRYTVGDSQTELVTNK